MKTRHMLMVGLLLLVAVALLTAGHTRVVTAVRSISDVVNDSGGSATYSEAGPPLQTATPTPTPPAGGSFNPSHSASLTSYGAGQNANIYVEFSIPAPDYNFDFAITFTPADFFVAADADVPDGALVGSVDSTSTLGLINGPCNSTLPVFVDLMEATADTFPTVTFDDQFQDADANTLPDGVDKYPDYLTRIIGYAPRARYFGQASVAGSPVSLNVLVFEPSTLSFDPYLGYQIVTIINNNGDPGMEPAPSAITDFCTPLDTFITTFGISGDNPSTANDEGGYVVRANPGPGTYTFSAWAQSQWDADGDGIENQLDTCPFDPNAGSPRVAGSGDYDNDGLDNACDPEPDVTRVDEDGDAYTNRGDNCPLVPNGTAPDNQTDTDNDGIGDACDPDPFERTGTSLIAGPLESTVTIDGETCLPVIPGTYNGTVTLNGLPAPNGTVINAVLGGIVWASDTTSGGRYVVDVPQTLPTEPPCFEGGLIQFEAEGVWCQPTVEWQSGLHDVNLTCGGAPAVTVRVDQGITIDALGIPGPGLGAYTLDVTYSPDAFTPLTCNPNPGGDFDSSLCNMAYTPDTVRASALRTSPGLQGDVPLADIALQATAPVCPSDLTVSVPTLADSDGVDISAIVDHKWWVGDTDRDFDRDAVDALFCLQYVVGMRDGSYSCPMPAGQIYLPATDAGCDLDVDSVDCLFILQHVVGFRPVLCPFGGLLTPTPTATPSP